MKALLDNRTGLINEDIVVNEIKLNEALLLLKNLDGKKHTMLSLERKDNFILCIGGGNQFFIVTISNENSDSKTLLNPLSNESKIIEICAGGQYADFPDKFVVDLDLINKVVKHFYVNQEEKMNWEND